MRLAMRALVYLALPSVAFAWLLTIDVPASAPVRFEFWHEWASDALDHLTEAASYVALGAGVVAVLVALGLLFSVGSDPQLAQRNRR